MKLPIGAKVTLGTFAINLLLLIGARGGLNMDDNGNFLFNVLSNEEDSKRLAALEYIDDYLASGVNDELVICYEKTGCVKFINNPSSPRVPIMGWNTRMFVGPDSSLTGQDSVLDESKNNEIIAAIFIKRELIIVDGSETCENVRITVTINPEIEKERIIDQWGGNIYGENWTGAFYYDNTSGITYSGQPEEWNLFKNVSCEELFKVE